MKSHWYNSPDLKLFLQDPISEVTRRERTYLLLTATVGIFFAHTRLVPKEISVLGIQFGANQPLLAWWIILLSVVLYFLIAFALYCVTDYISWRRAARADLFRRAYAEMSADRTAAAAAPLGSHAAAAKKVGNQYATPYRVESRLWTMRCAFDLALPVAIGIYAIVALLLSAFRTV